LFFLLLLPDSLRGEAVVSRSLYFLPEKVTRSLQGYLFPVEYNKRMDGSNMKAWWSLGCCGVERRSKRTATDVENQDAPKRPRRITENTAISEESRDPELSGTSD
jgi:hypothetical protein